MSSSSEGALYELSVQQDIPPSPNGGPQCADWLPRFAGSSWLAYGASTTVVIATALAPSNPGEATAGRFFQQVLETGVGSGEGDCEEEEERGWVSSLGWAPIGPSVGQLAAATSRSIHIYSPAGLSTSSTCSPSMPEIPLAWEIKQVLPHKFPVLTFAWTGSGDGLLSCGSNVSMWARGREGFQVLWEAQNSIPQALASSSWSSRNLAATADQEKISENNTSISGQRADSKRSKFRKGKATIWWWEEGHEVQEIELLHPGEVLMLQWRPSKRSAGCSNDPHCFRPVLLTCCKDGTVRLWLEIDGSRHSMCSHGGSKEHMKPSFYVSAVIEVNRCLNGVLGRDTFLTWASETRPGGGVSEDIEDSSSSRIGNGGEVAACEWLVGVGPHGAVTLWSLHCLDDLLPQRCPRITFWQQGADLLPHTSSLPASGEVMGKREGPLMVKAVVQRPEGMLSMPPSSLDLFEAMPSGLFRWSRLWPPVSAIGTGGGLKTGTANVGIPPTGNKSLWGVSSEEINLDGHRGKVIQAAIHPSTSLRLAASVDTKGSVLLWDLSGVSSPQVNIMSSQTSGWKFSGCLSCRSNLTCSSFDLISWAPLTLSGGRTILLVASSTRVDCYLVSRNSLQSKRDCILVLSDHLHSLQCPVFNDERILEGVSAVPVPVDDSNEGSHKSRFIVLGIGSGGIVLASWSIELCVTLQTNRNHVNVNIRASSTDDGEPKEDAIHEDVGSSDIEFSAEDKHLTELGFMGYAGPLVKPQERIYYKDCLIGCVDLDTHEHVTSMAIMPATVKGFSSALGAEIYQTTRPYDLLTGCADGFIRFYKVCSLETSSPHLSIFTSSSFIWQKVGILKAHPSPVTQTAVSACGQKFASTSSEKDAHTVKIWEAETYDEDGEFELEGEISLSRPVVAMSWLDWGMGSLLFGIATSCNMRIYIHSRISSQKSISGTTSWTCLASYLSVSPIDNLFWSSQGSPIVTSRGHIRILSQWVWCQPLVLSSKLKMDTTSGSVSSLTSLRNGGNISRPGVKGYCALLEAAEALVCPLPDYHPTSILWSLFKGNKFQARACVRHLAHHIAASSSTPSLQSTSRTASSPSYQNQLFISRTDLTELLKSEAGKSTQEQANNNFGFTSSFSFMDSGTSLAPPAEKNNEKYSFLNNSSWLDEFASELTPPKPVKESQTQEALKMGGADPLSKTELEAIVRFIEDCPDIYQLSEEEQKHLLAVVDVLAEMDGVGQAAQFTGLDLSGQRFWLAYRYAEFSAYRVGGKKVDTGNFVMESKAMAWALQSDAKETLLDLCASEQSTWPVLRALGVGFWFTDAAPLKKKMEKVARAQYLANKDAKESALLYIALERRTVLAGLLKISKDERDRPLVDFLARDFQEKKHQAAALKNAYVLMGKHRHELAAAFFVLGGDIDSAVSICAKNLGDPQLGLVVSRLIEGSDGPIGRNLITKHILPAAINAGDCWLASICQWLLGCGIEAIRELTTGVQAADMTQCRKEQGQAKVVTCGTILLDPDVGDYCAMLASKPRLRAVPHRAEIMRTVQRATMRAALALRRAGLPLQALEHMTESSGSLPLLIQAKSSHDFQAFSAAKQLPTTDGFSIQLTGLLDTEERVESNWYSPEVVAKMHEVVKHMLAFQCISMLLQEHPQWASVGKISSKPSQVSKKVHPEGTNHAENGIGVHMGGHESESASVEDADKKFEEGMEALKNTFALDITAIVAGLITLAANHHRLYMHKRLMDSQDTHLQSLDCAFRLSSKSEVPLRARPVEHLLREAPWVLARTILACGGSVTPVSNDRYLNGVASSLGVNSIMPWEFIQELARYAGEIQRLAASVRGDSGFGETRSTGTASHRPKEELKGKSERAMILLSYVYHVAAAWLGKQGEALVELVGPTINDPSKAPELPSLSANTVNWFEELCLGKNCEKRNSTTPQNPGDGGTAMLQEDEIWRIAGVELWVHILSYIKKQLARTGKDSVYSGFGRVSVPQSPRKSPGSSPLTAARTLIQSPPPSPSNRLVSSFLGLSPKSSPSESSAAWSEIKNKMRDETPLSRTISADPTDLDVVACSDNQKPDKAYEDLYVSLLSSIACIAAGLRQQLAIHVQHLLYAHSNKNSVILWLWGKPAESAANVASSGLSSLTTGTPNKKQGSSDSERPAREFPVVYPTTVLGGEDEACKELWRLLVVREKVRSALEIEGVNGPQPWARKMAVSGWRIARRKSAPTTGTSSISSNNPSTSRIAETSERSLSEVGRIGVHESQGSVNDKQQEEFSVPQFQKSESILHLSGELIEAFCVNSCDHNQVVLASNRKGLVYLDLETHGPFTETTYNLWSQADWPRNGWAGAVSTPVPTYVSPGFGLGGRRGSGIGLGGAAVGVGAPPKQGGVAFGMPGYGGMGAWGGWEEWEDVDGYIDPVATVENVSTKALAAHPLQPLFLVGSNNTHVYLWEFGKPSAMATYGVLPAANVPPPYVLASVASVRFDWCGHRFVTAALDGTVSTWQLEVGGRSNVRPTESRLCFGNHASDAAFVGGSGFLVAATGMSVTGDNLIVWDTLAPPTSSRASVACHDGGARCLSPMDVGIGGSSSSPWIVSGGKGGDVAVHDFRYIATKKAKRPRHVETEQIFSSSPTPQCGVGEVGRGGMLWSLPKAHSGSITKVIAVPGTSYFFSGSKDGDVKLWDVSTCSMVGHWHKVHDRHTFLQTSSRGFGSVVQQAAVTDVQPITDGFITCGGDGMVKLCRHQHVYNNL